MKLVEALQIIETGWKETVRPNIEKGEYTLAMGDMENLNFVLNAHFKQFTSHHPGPSFIAQARIVQKQLSDGKIHPETINEFEAYLAQTRLSVSTNNVLISSKVQFRINY